MESGGVELSQAQPLELDRAKLAETMALYKEVVPLHWFSLRESGESILGAGGKKAIQQPGTELLAQTVHSRHIGLAVNGEGSVTLTLPDLGKSRHNTTIIERDMHSNQSRIRPVTSDHILTRPSLVMLGERNEANYDENRGVCYLFLPHNNTGDNSQHGGEMIVVPLSEKTPREPNKPLYRRIQELIAAGDDKNLKFVLRQLRNAAFDANPELNQHYVAEIQTLNAQREVNS